MQREEHYRRTSLVVSGSNSLLVVPGLLLVVCDGGLCLLHPETLDRVLVKGMRDSDSTSNPQDGLLYPQFSAIEPKVTILKVLHVNCVEESGSDGQEEEARMSQLKVTVEQTTQQEMEENEDVADHLLDDGADFGSCQVAIAINNRLLVLNCPAR